MRNLGQLYRFEIKKIMKNRLTIAMLIVAFVFILIEAFIPKIYLTKEMMDAQKILDKAVIDDSLLQEMYPELLGNGTMWTSDNNRYEQIADMESAILPDGVNLSDYSADEMYNAREEAIFSMMNEDKLSDEELQWWKNEYSKTKTKTKTKT